MGFGEESGFGSVNTFDCWERFPAQLFSESTALHHILPQQ